MPVDFAKRRNRLRSKFKQVDAMLITDEANVSWLTGFTGDSTWVLLTSDGDVALSDPRYTEQLEQECPGLELEIRSPAVKLHDAAADLVTKTKAARLAFEADAVSVRLHECLVESLPNVELVSTAGWTAELREVKDKFEVEAIRRAIRIAEKAFLSVRASLRGNLTEKQIADDLDRQIRLLGGNGCSFKPIVAVGANAALPHAVPGERLVSEHGVLLIDWGALANQYISDLTRTLFTARISPKVERIYGVVLQAQLAAIDAVKHGALMNEVDAAARDVIAEAGFAKKFQHGLGHGIGLRVHESVRLGQTENRPLKTGMVITIEPGIYLPGEFGVRIEDDILVTKTGAEVLSSVPKSIEESYVDLL